MRPRKTKGGSQFGGIAREGRDRVGVGARAMRRLKLTAIVERHDPIAAPGEDRPDIGEVLFASCEAMNEQGIAAMVSGLEDADGECFALDQDEIRRSRVASYRDVLPDPADARSARPSSATDRRRSSMRPSGSGPPAGAANSRTPFRGIVPK